MNLEKILCNWILVIMIIVHQKDFGGMEERIVERDHSVISDVLQSSRGHIEKRVRWHY